MKFSKRLLTFLLSLVMILSTCAFVVSAETTEDDLEGKVPETHFAFSKASEWWFKSELWDESTGFWGEGTRTQVIYNEDGSFYVNAKKDLNYDYTSYYQFNMMHQNVPASEDVVYIDVTNNLDQPIKVKFAIPGYETPADENLPILAAKTTQRFELGVLEGGNIQVLFARVEPDFLPLMDNSFEVSALYTLVDPPEPEFTYGDVNDDGEVNGKDSLALRKYNADYPDEINLLAADVNADGKVNAKDSLILRRYNANWYNELPVIEEEA